jgi:hypothetical protein
MCGKATASVLTGYTKSCDNTNDFMLMRTRQTITPSGQCDYNIQRAIMADGEKLLPKS